MTEVETWKSKSFPKKTYRNCGTPDAPDYLDHYEVEAVDKWREETKARLSVQRDFCNAHIHKNLKRPPNNLAEMYFFAKREVIMEFLEALG